MKKVLYRMVIVVALYPYVVGFAPDSSETSILSNPPSTIFVRRVS